VGGKQMDQIARALATGLPRRRVAKGLLAGGAAGLVALTRTSESQAIVSCEGDCYRGCRNRRGRNVHDCARDCLCSACGIEYCD
jgi:hypothetical protein